MTVKFYVVLRPVCLGNVRVRRWSDVSEAQEAKKIENRKYKESSGEKSFPSQKKVVRPNFHNCYEGGKKGKVLL